MHSISYLSGSTDNYIRQATTVKVGYKNPYSPGENGNQDSKKMIYISANFLLLLYHDPLNHRTILLYKTRQQHELVFTPITHLFRQSYQPHLLAFSLSNSLPTLLPLQLHVLYLNPDFLEFPLLAQNLWGCLSQCP